MNTNFDYIILAAEHSKLVKVKEVKRLKIQVKLENVENRKENRYVRRKSNKII